jgi:ionotropic glutamate receptor
MRKRYRSKHVLILRILFIEMGLAQNSTAYVGVNVGVVLYTWNVHFDVNISLSCIKMALSDFYMPLMVTKIYKTRLILTTRDSKRDVVRAAAAGPSLPVHFFCCPFSYTFSC